MYIYIYICMYVFVCSVHIYIYIYISIYVYIERERIFVYSFIHTVWVVDYHDCQIRPQPGSQELEPPNLNFKGSGFGVRVLWFDIMGFCSSIWIRWPEFPSAGFELLTRVPGALAGADNHTDISQDPASSRQLCDLFLRDTFSDLWPIETTAPAPDMLRRRLLQQVPRPRLRPLAPPLLLLLLLLSARQRSCASSR